jgi:recombinational DNA repair ATPase RecF
MKIQSLSVKYSTRNICIQDVEFNNGLSLLVGVSGVGKTQILDAICDIKQIALGKLLTLSHGILHFH